MQCGIVLLTVEDNSDVLLTMILHSPTQCGIALLMVEVDSDVLLTMILHSQTQCDIALLTVEDDEFWEGAEGLDIGGLPHMQERAVVVGVSAACSL